MGGMVIDKYSVAVSKNRANLKVTSRQIVLDAPDGWSDSFNNIKISFFEPTLSRCLERKTRLSSAERLAASISFRGGVDQWNRFASSVSITWA
jgi:hypothetical protein